MTIRKEQRRPICGRRNRLGAFSLVELLVVIAVIGLLATIVLPSMMAVKDAAKAAATRALLSAISTSLDTYKSETRLGRDYPPSIWDTNGGDDDPNMASENGDNYIAYGAQTLVWALAGADMLGTPGFDLTKAHLTRFSGNPPGLYAVRNGVAVFPRFGPFIDISKLKLMTPTAAGITLRQLGGREVNAELPFVADKFERPILYFRPYPNLVNINVYQLGDNYGFIDPGRDTIRDDNSFYRYILDSRSTQFSPVQLPYNRDSFLLISAGIDGRFGTKDDVANFPSNVQQ